MEKFAVISAFPNANNPGMITSDLAFSDFCTKYICTNFTFDRFCIEKEVTLHSKKAERQIVYKKLTDPDKDLEQYDLIFFWGDFLHAKNYLDPIIKRMKGENKHLSLDQITDFVYKTLLFENVSEKIIEKTISFGGALLINQEYFDSQRYKLALKRLYNNCLFHSHRDPISNSIAVENSENPNTFPGVDCAFFYNDRQIKTKRAEGLVMGHSFGRRTIGKRRKVINSLFKTFIRRSKNVKEVVDIDWLSNEGEYPVDNTLKKIDALKSCDFILTDTYHCAANTWRLGIPAFCIGRGLSQCLKSVHDKKKELLYMMFQALPFYIYYENLENPLKWRRIKEDMFINLENQDFIKEITLNIKSSKDRVGHTLSDILKYQVEDLKSFK